MTKRFSSKLSRTAIGMSGRAQKRNRLLGGLAMTVVALASLRPAAAQTNGYHVTDLGRIATGASSTSLDLNDNGSVVGLSQYSVKGSKRPIKRGWVWTPTVVNGTSGTLRALVPFSGDGRADSQAYSINNAGIIVGASQSPTSSAFNVATFWQASTGYAPENFNRLQRATMSDPSLANWTFTDASRISNPVSRIVNGQIVETGEIYVLGKGRFGSSTSDEAIVWRIVPATSTAPTTVVGVTRMQVPNPSYPDAPEIYDVNNRGQVAGYAPGTPTDSACLWDGFSGTYTFLPKLLNNTLSYGLGLNDNGVVVGAWWNATGLQRGLVWTEGTTVELGTLGGHSNSANDINNLNQIVGWSYTPANTIRACLWWNGEIRNLNDLKASGATTLTLQEAYGINNKGAIIGSGSWLLTPR
jgi:probable HAF family extracellular repeat protein